MTQKQNAKTVVLRKTIDDEEASKIIEDKKTSLFKSLLKKPKKEKSGFKRAFVGNRGKNKIDLPFDEHVFVEEEDELVFDHNGTEIKFPFKIDSKTIENYPEQILTENSTNVKKPKISYDSAIDSLKKFLKSPLESDIRKLNEEFTLKEIQEVYVPIYEARLTGPKNKVGLLRLDAVRKKVL